MCVAETPDELDRFRAALDEFGERESLSAEKAAEVLQGRRLLPALARGGMPADVFAELTGRTGLAVDARRAQRPMSLRLRAQGEALLRCMTVCGRP